MRFCILCDTAQLRRLRAGLLNDLLRSRRVLGVPAQAQRRADLDRPAEAPGGEIELASCQPANVIGRATFCRHQLLSRVDRRGRAHAAVNMRRAVGHDLVVDPFRQLGRENHAQPVFPRQIRLRFRRTEIDVSFNAKSNSIPSPIRTRPIRPTGPWLFSAASVVAATRSPSRPWDRGGQPLRRGAQCASNGNQRCPAGSARLRHLRLTVARIVPSPRGVLSFRRNLLSGPGRGGWVAPARKIDRCRGAHPSNCVDEKLRVTTPGSQSHERNQQADGRDQSWPRKNVFSICCGERKPRVDQAMFGRGRQCDKGL